MRAAKLPGIEKVLDLIEGQIFVAYGLRNIDITRQREPRAVFAKREEKLRRQLAQAAFALDLVDMQLSGPLTNARLP